MQLASSLLKSQISPFRRTLNCCRALRPSDGSSNATREKGPATSSAVDLTKDELSLKQAFFPEVKSIEITLTPPPPPIPTQ